MVLFLVSFASPTTRTTATVMKMDSQGIKPASFRDLATNGHQRTSTPEARSIVNSRFAHSSEPNLADTRANSMKDERRPGFMHKFCGYSESAIGLRPPLWQLRLHYIFSGTSAFATVVGLCEASTNLVKLAIQRKRPNFYALCEFNTETRECTNPDPRLVREANFSFPSGHSSFSMACMTFLSWYLLSHFLSVLLQDFYRGRSLSRKRMMIPKIIVGVTVCVFLPMSYTIWVGVTRITDLWHHPSDVIAGFCLGCLMGNVGYHIHFPNPLAYFMLALLSPRYREHLTKASAKHAEQFAIAPNDAIVPKPCVPWIIRDFRAFSS
jgi:membrane-associated phospholipid phosphatase